MDWSETLAAQCRWGSLLYIVVLEAYVLCKLLKEEDNS